MPQQMNDNSPAHDTSWYVMWHLSPQQIETMLQKDSAGLFTKPDESPLPPYRFFVPFQYMPILHHEQNEAAAGKRYNPRKDQNALRNDLHNFVLIQASEERIRAIVSSDWNTKARLRLNYYRDTNRHEVIVSDAEVRLLMDTIQNRHLQFYIDQPLDDFAAGDKVILQMEPWTGKHGVVKKVALKHGQLCMTISMNILGRTKSINFTDVRVGDVLFEDAERGRMLSDNPINNYEEEIIDLLSHRFGHRYTDEVAEQDRIRLRRLATYDHIYVDDADEHARFVALKLICAYLLKNAKKRDHYHHQVLALLQSSIKQERSDNCDCNATLSRREFLIGNSELVASTEVEAYLMTALFLVTRQACWRDAVKLYRNTHPDCPVVLRRFHAILKDLKAKR